jgi:hypothetical protein
MRRLAYPRERPEDFRLNTDCLLAQGAVFLGLGALAGSTLYHDASLYGNHGTLTNMAVPATATSGWAWDKTLRRWTLTFDGSDDYVVCGKALNTSASGTMAAWVLHPVNQASWPVIMGDERWATNRNGATMGFDATQWLYADTATATTYARSSGVSAAAWTGKWFHFAVVWVTGTPITTYLNGVQNVGANNALTPTGGPQPFTLGKDPGGAVCYLNGSLADPGVWNRALCQPEISALADPSNVMLSGLILPPRRRVFAASTGNRRRRLLIAGAA